MKFEKIIVASGPVIIENGKLLVSLDNKDDFYKIPGGTVNESDNSLEETCMREVKEEINADIDIIKPLHPMLLDKNPKTGKKQTIVLIHYQARLKNKTDLKAIPPVKEYAWLDIDEIKKGSYKVAPNIEYLIKMGDIK
ncbi:MAG TPA: NUDIX domain-containing protein [Candidatus Paceibacterota bacterium]|nr:NUDIX domain-containing protein [Candidatus Paceibacterota bacterium]